MRKNANTHTCIYAHVHKVEKWRKVYTVKENTEGGNKAERSKNKTDGSLEYERGEGRKKARKNACALTQKSGPKRGSSLLSTVHTR